MKVESEQSDDQKQPDLNSEAKRLAALNSYQVLDTSNESAFDELVALCADICEVPICMISLLDAERQWFKASIGLDVKQTVREAAFCNYTICQQELFEVPDVCLDMRFAHNLLVVEAPHIRFYAAFPLINADGYALGSLCVLDRKPRCLNDLQRKSLQILARQVVQLLELRRAGVLKIRELELIERTRQCQNELNALSSELDMSFYDRIMAALDILVVYSETDAAGIYQLEDDFLRILALRYEPPYGDEMPDPRDTLVPLAGTNAEQILNHPGVWAWQEQPSNSPARRQAEHQYQLTDLFGVRYLIEGQPAGVIICHRVRQNFEPLHPLQREFLQMFAIWIASRFEQQKHDARERDWIDIHQLALSSSRSGLLVIPDITSEEMILSSHLFELLGYQQEQLLMKRSELAKLIEPSDLGPAQLALKQAETSKSPFSTDFRLKHALGHTIWVRLHATFAQTASGIKMVGIIRDITPEKTLEQNLRSSEERAHRILEVSPIPKLIIEMGDSPTELAEYRVVHINTAFTSLLGYQMGEIHDMEHLLQLLYPDPEYRHKIVKQNLQKLDVVGQNTLQASLKTSWVTTRDGQQLLVERLMSRAGNQIILCYYDLTERYYMEAKLRANEAQLQQYLDALPLGVWIMGPDYHLKYANQRAGAILGKAFVAHTLSTGDLSKSLSKLEPIYIRGTNQLYPPERNPFVLALQGKTLYIDDADVQVSDVKIPVDIWTSPVFDEQGSVVSGIVAFNDVTERKEMDDALRAAKNAAESANHAKSAFLANMSHEIRTPMNAVIGLNQLLAQTQLNVRQQDYVTKIRQAAEGLLGIINDILDVSKIEAGKLILDKSPFCPESVLASVTSLIGLNAAQKGIELLIEMRDLPQCLIGDALRLEQILLNLTGNAVKFTNKGSVRILAETLEATETDALLRFCIIDTGIGIAPEQKKRLFQAFNQADVSITRHYGGTGLGLTIARQLVELMNGEIGFESQTGQGSQFWFTIRCPRSKRTEQQELTLDRRLKNLRALIADDQAESREIARNYLESFGMSVREVDSGLAVFDAINDEPVDLLLLDWRMPEMDGEKTLLELQRRLPKHQLPAILIITAYGREDLSSQVKAFHFKHILTKPLLPSPLYNAVISSLGFKSARRNEALGVDTLSTASLDGKRGAHILLVEDHPINQQVAGEMLEAEGFKITIAEHGLEALQKIEKQAFDLVLMDLQMPVMDGFTAALEISKRWPELPVLALSADVVGDVRDRVLAAGMHELLGKPINQSALFEALAHWLPLRHAEEPQILAKPLPLPVEIQEWQENLEQLGLQIQPALKRLRNKTSLYLKLLDQFVSEQTNFKSRYDCPDFNEQRRQIHTLRGTAGSLGLNNLEKIAEQLETVLKQNQVISLDELYAEFERILPSLKRVIESTKNESLSENLPKNKNTLDDLSELESSIARFDPKALQLATDLKGLNSEQHQKLIYSLERFDFRTAAIYLENLRSELETQHAK